MEKRAFVEKSLKIFYVICKIVSLEKHRKGQTFQVAVDNVIGMAICNGIRGLHKEAACAVLIKAAVWTKQIHQT